MKRLIGLVFATVLLTSISSTSFAIDKLHFIIGGGAGGGWDGTARGTGEALTKSGMLKSASFENMSGGGGGKETIVNSSSALSGTINLDFQTSQIYHYTGNAGGNWTVNFRGSSSVTLNSEMSTDQSLTFVLYVQQGSTAYYNNGWQIDGSGKTPKWLGGFGKVIWSTVSSVKNFISLI